MEFGFIYKVTCKETNKIYVGQAREHKHKKGKPYKYGVKGRWCDHVSSALSSNNTPLAQDICKYGKDAFEVEELVKDELNSLDALEADWIEKLNSVVPNGYNVMRHSQNKHRNKTNITTHFTNKTVSARLSKIRNDGIYKLVYCNLALNDGTNQRVVFGQHKNKTFEDAWKDALDFVNKLNIPFTEDTSNSDDPLERYIPKLKEFVNKEITKVRIAKANSLVAVYVTTADMKSWKDQKRICFGGKTVSEEEAYTNACMFVDNLNKNKNTTIEDTFNQSQQQVAASMDETTP
jgi:hypothetical protein